MEVRLVVVGGPEAGRIFTFDGADSFLVGRSPRAHLVLDPNADRYISRTHCLIDIRLPRCIVHDLGSTNGTYVNGERIDRAEVGDGDEVRVGRTRIRVLMPVLAADQAADAAQSVAMATRSSWSPSENTGWHPQTRGGTSHSVGQSSPAEAPRLACWLCDADLSDVGDIDGRAAQLPDAIYLCGGCTGSVTQDGVDVSRIGAYSVLGELGRGGMGIVYKAVHDMTRRLVAIKRILPEVSNHEKVFRLFEREIGVQSTVEHPNLVKVLDHGREPGCCFFVVEYLAGGDVADLVSSVFKGPVEPSIAIRITTQVLAGLDALHGHGYIHRDLKPSNILLSRLPQEGFGTAKVTDYGLAKSFEEAGNSLFDFTREGEAAGSLMFMPPEQILNYRYVKPPADVYAAGVTLYYLLSTHYTVDCPVWGGANDHGTSAGRRNPIEALIEDPPIPLATRRPDLNPRLAEVVDTAVKKDLDERYPSAAAFRDDLLAVAREEGFG